MKTLRPLTVMAVTMAVAYFFRDGQVTWDFRVIHTAATHAFGPIYDPEFHRLALRADHLFPWAYPPTFLLMVLPLGPFSTITAYVLWVGILSAAFVEAAALRVGKWAPLLLVCPTYIISAGMGQTTLIMGPLVVAGMSLVNTPILAGVALGFATCIKPQIVVLLPLALFISGRWTTIMAAGATSLVLILISALIFGPDIWVAWLTALPRFIEINDALGIRRVRPDDFLVRALVGAVGLAALWKTSKKGDIDGQITTAVITALLISPHGVRYDLAVAAPALMAMVREKQWRSIPALLVLTFLIRHWPELAITVLLIALPLPDLRGIARLAAHRYWPINRKA